MPSQEAHATVQRIPRARPRAPVIRQLEGPANDTSRTALRRGPGGARSQGSRALEQSRRISWVYLKYGLTHPWHLVVLAGATVLGVAHWSLVAPLLAFLGVELLLLGVVIRLRAFRRYVDGRLDQIARAHAAEQRNVLLAQMCEEHRCELAALEVIVDRTRDASTPYGAAAHTVLAECQSLLSSYVRLAIAYNVSRQCLASVDRPRLDDERRMLESLLASTSAGARDLAARRLGIARKRIERWDRSRETLEAIGQQLAMIGDLVRLTHEQLAAPIDPSRDTEEIDCMVRVLDSGHEAADELTELLRVEQVVDPQVLELGRAQRE
jgi:hypothetical protein